MKAERKNLRKKELKKERNEGRKKELKKEMRNKKVRMKRQNSIFRRSYFKNAQFQL